MVLMQLHCHLVNEYETNEMKDNGCQLKKTTISAPLVGPLGQSPPECEVQCPGLTSVPV